MIRARLRSFLAKLVPVVTLESDPPRFYAAVYVKSNGERAKLIVDRATRTAYPFGVHGISQRELFALVRESNKLGRLPRPFVGMPTAYLQPIEPLQ